MTEEMQETVDKINAARSYLIWGTVDKAYKMLDELSLTVLRLAHHIAAMEDQVDRLTDK